VEKTVDQFRPDPRYADGYHCHCRECRAKASYNRYHADREGQVAYRTKRREDNPAVALAAHGAHLKHKYGITLADFNRMVAERNGRCDVCHRKPKGGKRTGLHVDHDHATGEVRGLLCGPCNRAIGLLGDSPEVLRKALAYLERREIRLFEPFTFIA
jgi:hypothetical protein